MVSHQNQWDHLLKESETIFDTKLSTFMLTITQSFEKEISKIKEVYECKINALQMKNAEFKIHLQKQISDFIKEQRSKEKRLNKEELIRNDFTKHKTKIYGLIEKCEKHSDIEVDIRCIEAQLKKHKDEMELLKNEMGEPTQKILTMASNTLEVANISVEVDKIVTSNEKSKSITKTKDIDILICMDSNRKYVDFRKLWTLKGSKRVNSETINELEKYINNNDIKSLNNILINVGMNDIDSKSGIEVFDHLKGLTIKVRSQFPCINIIVSEVTPRADNRDSEVIICNDLLKQYISQEKNMHLAVHDNLRHSDYSLFCDKKHLKKNAVPLFAANIKKALRQVYAK